MVGSQAILGSHPNAPEKLLRSAEADVYPMRDPAKADLIDGSLGDGSMFHRTYGYYAHGVGPETARAPAGWQERLIRVELEPRGPSDRRPVALCLEPHDLVLSKCVAGRERDWGFAADALRAGVVEAGVLLDRIEQLPLEGEAREKIRDRLRQVVTGVEGNRA